jgi:hypothetical protein
VAAPCPIPHHRIQVDAFSAGGGAADEGDENLWERAGKKGYAGKDGKGVFGVGGGADKQSDEYLGVRGMTDLSHPAGGDPFFTIPSIC